MVRQEYDSTSVDLAVAAIVRNLVVMMHLLLKKIGVCTSCRAGLEVKMKLALIQVQKFPSTFLGKA